MTLQSSGAISMNDIHMEVGGVSATTVSLNDSDVRALAEIPSGSISFLNFYGKSAAAAWDPVSGANTNLAFESGGTTYYSSEIHGFTTEYFNFGSWLNSPLLMDTGYNTSHTVKTFTSTRNTSNNTYTAQFALAYNGSNQGFTSVKIVQANGTETILYRTDASFLGSSSSHRWTWSGLSAHAFPDDGTITVVGIFF